MKTKPFNIEAALVGAPVVTRDGRRVLSIGFDRYPISAKIECEEDGYFEETFTLSGRRYGDNLEAEEDLFMLDEEGGEE